MKKSDKLVALCILLIALFVSIKLDHSSQASSRPESEWKKISPFTDMKFEDEKIVAEYDGMFYELTSIAEITTPELIKSSKKNYGQKWQKRIREDIADVLIAAGATDSTTVKLELKDLETGTIKTIAEAEMTRENRQKYYNTTPDGAEALDPSPSA